MVKISLIFKMLWRKKVAGTIIPYNLKFNLNMTMMKYTLLTATHIHTQIVVIYLKDFVQIKLKTKYAKLF